MIKGNPGYMAECKKKNRRYGLLGLFGILFVYFTGLILHGDNGSGWTLFAVLLALPTAQFMARYFSLRSYHSVEKATQEAFDHLEEERVLYELALVIGRHTYYLDTVVIGGDTLHICTENPHLEGEKVELFLRQKGIQTKVCLYKAPSVMAQKMKGQDIPETQTLHTIKKILLENAL